MVCFPYSIFHYNSAGDPFFSDSSAYFTYKPSVMPPQLSAEYFMKINAWFIRPCEALKLCVNFDMQIHLLK